MKVKGRVLATLVLVFMVIAAFTGSVSKVGAENGNICVKLEDFTGTVDGEQTRVYVDSYDIAWAGDYTIRCTGSTIYTASGDPDVYLSNAAIAMIVYSEEGAVLAADNIKLGDMMKNHETPFYLATTIPQKQSVYVKIRIYGGGILILPAKGSIVNIDKSEYELKYSKPSTPTSKPSMPAFRVSLAIVYLLAVAYLFRRRR